jgi:hypothetical protein
MTGADELCRRLRLPDTLMEDVLVDSSLPSALHCETETVVSFFTHPASLGRLLEYSLTTTLCEDANYMKLSRLSTSFLCCDRFELSRAVMDSDLFIAALSSFSAFSRPVLCGNFTRFVDRYIRVSPGNLLDRIPTLPDTLVAHLDVLAFRFLAVKLLRECCSQMGSLLALLSPAVSAGSYDTLTVVRDLLADRQRSLIGVDLRPFLRAALDFAALPDVFPLHRTEAFMLCALIIDSRPGDDFEPILDEYEDRIDFSRVGIERAAALQVFTRRFPQALDVFLEAPTNSALGDSVVAYFENSSVDEQRDFVRGCRMVPRIIAAGAHKCAGHLTQIAMLMHEIAEVRQDEDWAKFYEEVVAPKVNLMWPGRRAATESEWPLPSPGAAAAFQASFESSSDDQEDEAEDNLVDIGQEEEEREVDVGKLLADVLGRKEKTAEEEHEEESEADRQRNLMLMMMLGGE